MYIKPIHYRLLEVLQERVDFYEEVVAEYGKLTAAQSEDLNNTLDFLNQVKVSIEEEELLMGA